LLVISFSAELSDYIPEIIIVPFWLLAMPYVFLALLMRKVLAQNLEPYLFNQQL